MNDGLPTALDAERGVLGIALLRGKMPPELADLEPADCFHPAHVAILGAMRRLDADGKPLDHVTVYAALEGDPLRALGGAAYLGDLMNAAVSNEPTVIEHHADMIAECAARRRAMEAGPEVTRLAGLGDDGWRDAAESAVYAATRSGTKTPYRTSAEVLREVLPCLEKRHSHPQEVTGIPTGLRMLDGQTAGWQPGDLVIIAARPSMGKTALAMGMAEQAAVTHRIPALVFSLEMSGESLMERCIAGRAGIELSRLRRGDFPGTAWAAIQRAASDLAEAPLSVDDSAALTVAGIRAKARRWRAGHDGFGLVVVDYLQLVTPERQSKEQSRDRDVADISRGLKALARELGVPVVALSQLNRGCESRTDKRPNLGDLRDSGAIEQDADVVVFIYRDEVYHEQSNDRGTAELIVSKQRNGPVGTLRVAYLGERTRFADLADDWHSRNPEPQPKRGRMDYHDERDGE